MQDHIKLPGPQAFARPVPGAADIDVCICTFRRPHVVETIASIARQNAVGAANGGLTLRVIVADNDDTPSAREAVEAAFAANGVNGVYLHAPSRNISIARNACLDAITAPLAAFIDDDETAHDEWLSRLVGHLHQTRADVVFGRVAAVYPSSAPSWMVRADMHSTRAVERSGAIETGYSGNVLFRTEALRGLRFDLGQGKSGGEDTLFFNTLHLGGAKLSYCADAVIDEPVPESRTTLRWLLRRSYRYGQTYAEMRARGGKAEGPSRVLSALKVIWCLAQTAISLWSPVRWRLALVRAALHAGVVGASFGHSTLETYGHSK